jgi:hypothetical protein
MPTQGNRLELPQRQKSRQLPTIPSGYLQKLQGCQVIRHRATANQLFVENAYGAGMQQTFREDVYTAKTRVQSTSRRCAIQQRQRARQLESHLRPQITTTGETTNELQRHNWQADDAC